MGKDPRTINKLASPVLSKAQIIYYFVIFFFLLINLFILKLMSKRRELKMTGFQIPSFFSLLACETKSNIRTLPPSSGILEHCPVLSYDGNPVDYESRTKYLSRAKRTVRRKSDPAELVSSNSITSKKYFFHNFF